MSTDFVAILVQWLPKLAIAAAIAAIAYVLIEPLLVRSELGDRMKSVLAERDRIRQRERVGLASGTTRFATRDLINRLSAKAKLALWLLDAETQHKLARAGYRASSDRATFLTMRLAAIVGTTVLFVLYCLISNNVSWLIATPLAAWVGLRLSTYSLERIAAKRDAAMAAGAPDVIDLLTICVESGMSIEVALQRVAEEMTLQNEIVADELSVTAAELSYVPKRSDAFANLIGRTQAKPIQSLCVALIQADSFGTSIGATLRVQSAEARKMRQLNAERRALSIPPKLSVVMVFFFMPVIMIVMLYPSITKMMGMNTSF